MNGPLAGLRVVDCTSGIAGPRATGLFADYGADVVWVETPGGDPLRAALAVEYSVFNRGKRSVELDLETAEGRATLTELLRNADLFIETWPVGDDSRLGFDAAMLSSVAPHLVHCSITGFGSEGSLSHEPQGELIAQALSGVMGEQVGWREGPIPSAVPLASIGAAYLAALGSLGAVWRAREDGVGRHVETSLFDGALSFLSMLWGITDGAAPMGPGAGHKPGTIRLVSSSYRCSDDEYLGIHTGAVGAFSRFIEVLGLTDRIPPTTTGVDMGTPLTEAQSRIVIEEIPEIFTHHTRAYWLDLLLAADVCAVPHLHSGQVFDEPQARHNHMSVIVEDPELGTLEQVGLAAKFGRSVSDLPVGAPTPGRDDPSAVAAAWHPRIPAVRVRTSDGRPDRPLFDGLKIIDAGAYYAGPYSSRLLGDLGADVIKVEPIAGDQLRGLAKVFRSASANKRSIALDLKRPELAATRDALLAWADVVHHNMRPGAAERLGIGYDHVAALNPQAVYLYAPGWGSSGPDRSRQSFAPMMSGYVGAGLEVAGRFNAPLYPLGNEDPGNGLLGAVAVAMALIERQTSGFGQYIENPQLNATMAHLAHVVRRPGGEVLGAMRLDPLQYGFGALKRVYECADGWIVLDGHDAVAEALMSAFGLDATDVRFSTAEARAAHDDDLADVVSDAVLRCTVDDAVKQCKERGVPVAIPVPYNCQRFVNDPEHLASGRAAAAVADDGTTWRAVGVLVRASGAPNPPFRIAPPLGGDSDSVLQMLGTTDTEIAELHDAHAIR